MTGSKDTMAAKADRYRLYEKSVQCPDADLDFVEQVFRELNGRKPTSLQEDFCASAYIACSWVKRSRRNTAIGVDLDEEVLEWGRKRHVSKLTQAQQKRLSLMRGDVMNTGGADMDVVLALNFSYWVFMDRKTIARYLRQAKKRLAKDGMLVIDVYGGSGVYKNLKESKKFKKFSYIWEQKQYDPATGKTLCHIHFAFPDKSRIKKAFSYQWRMWTLPELRDILADCGFNSYVYWEGEDENGEGNGEYSLLQGSASADEAWICYVVALPKG